MPHSSISDPSKNKTLTSPLNLNRQGEYIVIFPCFEPDNHFLPLLQELKKLIKQKEAYILIIDDGSNSKNAEEVFSSIEQLNLADKIIHLKHNLGKGNALKAGISYAQKQGFAHAVTADADGQHLPKDIVAIGKLASGREKLVIGKRNLGKNTPLRSKIGNFFTSFLLLFSNGRWVSDTQCGLRRIPSKFFDEAILTSGNKYEYEFQFLISKLKTNDTLEHPISTIYEIGNPTSHFRPIRDSMLFCFPFFRHVRYVITITILDFILILIFRKLVGEVSAVFCARAITLPLYYYAQKKRVWQSSKLKVQELVSFFTLVLFNICITGWALKVFFVSEILSNLFVYITVSLLLFVFNFFMLKKIFFTKTAEA
jgi:glycosyltransferase involved in cell wall biosynthesis